MTNVITANTIIDTKGQVHFHYPDTSVVFKLVEGVLLTFDRDDTTVTDIFKGSSITETLIEYGIPTKDFVQDFVGKGLKLDTEFGPMDLVMPSKENNSIPVGLYVKPSVKQTVDNGKESAQDAIANKQLTGYKLNNLQRQCKAGTLIYIEDQTTGQTYGSTIHSIVPHTEAGRFNIEIGEVAVMAPGMELTFEDMSEHIPGVKSIYLI